MAVLCGRPTIQYSARSARLCVRLSIVGVSKDNKWSVICHKARREIWPTGNRQSRAALFTGQKKTKILPLSLLADRAQNLPGPAQTMYSDCSRFRPNRFTFGGVIAERVNTNRWRTPKWMQYLAEAYSFGPNNHADIEQNLTPVHIRLQRLPSP